MSDINNKARRIIPNQSRTVPSTSTIIKPSVENIIQDAVDIVTNEIMKMKVKSLQGSSLNLNEARVLQGYIKSLVDLSKEMRDSRDSEDLANLSDSELLKLIEQLKGK